MILSLALYLCHKLFFAQMWSQFAHRGIAGTNLWFGDGCANIHVLFLFVLKGFFLGYVSMAGLSITFIGRIFRLSA